MKTDNPEKRKKQKRQIMIIMAAIYLVVAIALCFLPLVNLLGYEFSQAMAMLTVLAIGPLAVLGLDNKQQDPGEAYFGMFFKTIALLALSLAVILLNSLRVPLCNPADGFRFYLLLPVASAAVASALALFAGYLTDSKMRRLIIYYAIVVIWLLLDIHQLYVEPPIAFYSALWGYFPGPLYDEALKPGSALFLSRGASLLIVFALIFLLRIATARKIAQRGRAALLLAIVGALSLWYDSAANEAGIDLTREQLQQALGGHTETANLTIYHDEFYPSDELNLFIEDAEYNFERLREFFGYAPQRKLAIYLYRSAGQKKKLFGAGKTSVADVPHGELHINSAGFPHPIMRHELAHLFSFDIGPGPFGAPLTQIGLVEGLAVAADFGFTALDPDDATPHQVAAESMARQKLPRLDSLLGTLQFYGKANSLAYAAVGSFCRWLIDSRSMALFARVYAGETFGAVYGSPPAELEKEWHSYLETVETPPAAADTAEDKIKRRPIFHKTCAHENASLMTAAERSLRSGNYQRAAELAQRAADNDPDCAGCRFGIVEAAYAAQDCDRMNQAFTGLVDHEYTMPRMIERGVNWQGNCAWRKGESKAAEEIFLQLQNQAHSSGLKRELAAKLFLLQDENGARPLVDYFLGQPDSARLLALAAEAAILEPENGLAGYLLGRQLYFAGQYDLCLNWLAKSLAAEPISDEIRLELLRLYLKAAYLAGKNEIASMVIDELEQSENGSTMKLGLAEWRGRLLSRINRLPKQ